MMRQAGAKGGIPASADARIHGHPFRATGRVVHHRSLAEALRAVGVLERLALMVAAEKRRVFRDA
jgi:hypothetical protein